MADIFLSYAREDVAKAEQLALALEKKGWSVFWDCQSILPGQDFDEVIEQAIANMKCMVVLWSKSSRKSHYVRDEAKLGRDNNLLVPVLIDLSLAPMGFGSLQTENFSNWQGESDKPEFLNLCKAVMRLAGDTRTTNAPSVNSQPTPETTQLAFEPEMVIIPAGSFQMGSEIADRIPAGSFKIMGSFIVDCGKPIHAVTFAKPFKLGKYPVTFAEYDEFAKQTGRKKPVDEGWGRDLRPDPLSRRQSGV